MKSKTAIFLGLLLSLVCISSNAQDTNSHEFVTDFQEKAPLISNMFEEDDGESMATKNAFNAIPGKPAKTGLTVYTYQNYSFTAVYWNGRTVNRSSDCETSAPQHGFLLFRDGQRVENNFVTYSRWGLAGSAGLPTQYYCGRHRINSSLSGWPPGKYSIKFFLGNTVYEQALFTISEPKPQPKPCDGSVPIYGAVHWGATDFFMTLDPNRMSYLASMGYEDLGVVAKVPHSQNVMSRYTRPFERLFYNHPLTTHVYVVDDADLRNHVNHGWTHEGHEGYLFDRRVEGTVPLYRASYWNNHDMSFYYTVDHGTAEWLGAQPGWSFDGTIGYACPIN